MTLICSIHLLHTSTHEETLYSNPLPFSYLLASFIRFFKEKNQPSVSYATKLLLKIYGPPYIIQTRKRQQGQQQQNSQLKRVLVS